MKANAFDRDALEHLRIVSKAKLPGDRFAVIGLVVMAILTVFFCCVSTIILPKVGQSDSGTQASQTSTNNGRSPLAGFACCATIILGLVGFVAIIPLRIKLNRDFVVTNTLHLRYNKSNSIYAYQRFAKRLDDLCQEASLMEIAMIDDEFRHCGSGIFSNKLPKYLACNLEIYCLSCAGERYYFLPDSILVHSDTEFYIVPLKSISLETNEIPGKFILKRYREVMTNGRIRKDGGYDQRYNTSFGQEAYDGYQSFDTYGVLKFRFEKQTTILLTEDKPLAAKLGRAFQNWAEIVLSDQ